MKTNFFVAFLTVLLVISYIVVLRIQPDEPGDMARFIPGDALVYFEQRDGSNMLRDFDKSLLRKKIASIDFKATAKKIGLSDGILAATEEGGALYKTLRDDPLVNEIFGKRFGLALLSPIEGKREITVSDFFRANTVVIADPQHSAGILEFLGETYSNYSDEIFLSASQYGNHHINRLSVQGETISMATIDGLFILSFNERQLRRCIDTFDAERISLSQNNGFLPMRDDFKQTDRFVFISPETVRGFLSELLADITFTGHDLLQKELQTTVGFTAFGYGAWLNSNKVIDKIIVHYNGDEVNKLVKTHLSTAPKKSSLLSQTTENPMAYYWSNTLNFKHFLLYLDNEPDSDQRVAEFVAGIEKATDKSIEEILSLLGEEVSLVLEPGSNENFFPFPLGMFSVQVKAEAELQTVLDKLIVAYNIPVSVKNYGPVQYVYWTAAPQDGLRPVYGFWQDMFLFGNSTSLLKKIIDINKEEHSLLDNPTVRKMDPGLAEKNNSITYLNNVEIITLVQKLLNLVGTIVGVENRENAYKAQVVIDEIINPLLDGATMYDKSITRSYFTPGKVVIDSITHVITEPKE